MLFINCFGVFHKFAGHSGGQRAPALERDALRRDALKGVALEATALGETLESRFRAALDSFT